MKVDIAVSGAGIIGLCSAIAMQQKGYSVALLDASDVVPHQQERFHRMYAINAASQALLQSLGVWSELAYDDCTPYRAMKVSDACSGAEIRFDCRSLAVSELGHIIGEATLKNALFKVANASAGLQVMQNATIRAIDRYPPHIRLSTEKQTLQAELLMVAEGALSTTRALLGVPLHTWSYHQHAIVAQVETQRPHQNTARQIFLPSGPLAFLPLPNPKRCSIVWSAQTQEAKRLNTMSSDTFNQCIGEAFNHELGHIKLCGERYCFPLQMRHVKQYSGNAWLLLGDAAHSIHPLAGLGLNMGLADLKSWLTLIDSKPAKAFSRRMLQAYHRERSVEGWKFILALQGIKSLFDSPVSPLVHLRGFGLGMVNSLNPLKRLLIKQAAGL